MAVYRTAKGKMIDMASLAAKNEKTIAVGNMKVNSRGDKIDSNGRVIKSASEKVNDSYSGTVGNKSAIPTRAQPKIKEELSSFEREFDNMSEDDELVEKIKANERKAKK